MKKISITLLLAFTFFLISGCKGQEVTPSKYKDYNETMEKYFLAYAEGDLYTMKQYLPLQIINENTNIKNAKENDKPQKPERKEKMGDKYSITGFDYFYEDYGEIYYFIEYFNYERNDIAKLVFGVKEDNDKLIVFNAFGVGGIGNSHVKEINNGGYFTISSIQEAIKKYPEHAFVVKDYPEM